MSGEAKTSARRLRTPELRLTALELRKRGHSYAAIGAKMGISDSYAFKLVSAALAQLIKNSDVPAAEVRRLELEKLDAVEEALWAIARPLIEPDEEGKEVAHDSPDDLVRVKAVQQLINAYNSRARLEGLNAPTRLEASGTLNLAPAVIQFVMPDEAPESAPDGVPSE